MTYVSASLMSLLNSTIHQVDERTPVADLDRLFATYYDIIRRIIPSP